MRRRVIVPALALALAAVPACGSTGSGSSGASSPNPSAPSKAGGGQTQRLEAADRSFTIEVPKSWKNRPELAKNKTVIAAQGTEETLDQLIVTSYATAPEAEDEAVFVVTGLSGSGTACERLEKSTAFGGQRLVFDCPSETEGTKYRRLFFPVEHEGRSLLLLLQTTGASLDATVALGKPVLESLTFT